MLRLSDRRWWLTALFLVCLAVCLKADDAVKAPKTEREWRAYFHDLRYSRDGQKLFTLGSYYAAGHAELTSKPDLDKAFDYYKKAAELGHPEAQYRVGFCLEHKLGVHRASLPDAFTWYLKAANQEVPAAQLRVGEMYFNGDGVASDRDQAYHFLLKAAERGIPDAQRMLGDCHKLGWGTPRDYVAALTWYIIAAAQDNEAAAKSRDTIISIFHLTKEEIARAESAAKKFQPKS